MNKVTAVLSMLHQSPDRPGSAGRLFRGEPVLTWALCRLSKCAQIENRAILCWDDQFSDVQTIAEQSQALVHCKGRRVALPELEALAAARRWADGWRGGLLGASCFDLGFHAPSILEICKSTSSDAIVLVDPDAALIDPIIIDHLVEHTAAHDSIEYCFAPAAPGLGGFLIKAPLLTRMASAGGYPGRLLSYWPDTPGRDPIARDECAPLGTSVARTLHRFNLDSQRQIALLQRATEPLNGQLLSTDAESLVARVSSAGGEDGLPRDIVLELTTRRSSRPTYWPGRYATIDRPDLRVADAEQLFAQLDGIDDVRLTLGGVGDPLLMPDVFSIINAATAAGVGAIGIETDLLGLSRQTLELLAEAPVDVISINIPAVTKSSYAHMMGVDELPQLIDNLKYFFAARLKRQGGTPLVVPTFVKTRDNLHEMEAWYDHWLGAVGCAVIVGPAGCGGLINGIEAVDMSPPRRRACSRLRSRLTIHCDGSVVSCEEDVLGRQPAGNIRAESLRQIWRERFGAFRKMHQSADWNQLPVCANCKEWHRT